MQRVESVLKKSLLVCFVCALSACASLPPSQAENLCATFIEKDEWYEQARHASQKWGVPIPVLMAIMHQESHFVADAKTPRRWLLGIIPWFRESSAYGYAQAIDNTWEQYREQAVSWGAARDEFDDAADFIGWYCHVSYLTLHIAKTDAKNLYLAYHEGHRGFKSRTFIKKITVIKIAEKVAKQARQFQKQLNQCKI